MDEKLAINILKSFDTYEFEKDSDEYYRLNFVKIFVSIYYEHIVTIEINNLKIFPFDNDKQLPIDYNVLLFEKPKLNKFEPINIHYHHIITDELKEIDANNNISIWLNINQCFPKSPKSIKIRTVIPCMKIMTNILNRIIDKYIAKCYRHDNFIIHLLFNISKIIKDLDEIDDIGINYEGICRAFVDSLSKGVHKNVLPTGGMIKNTKINTTTDAMVIKHFDRKSFESIIKNNIKEKPIDFIEFFIDKDSNSKMVNIYLRCIDKKYCFYKYKQFEFTSIKYELVGKEQSTQKEYSVVQIDYDFSQLPKQFGKDYNIFIEQSFQIFKDVKRFMRKCLRENLTSSTNNLGSYYGFNLKYEEFDQVTGFLETMTIIYIKELPKNTTESFNIKQLQSLNKICGVGNNNHSILNKHVISKIIIRLLLSLDFLHTNNMFYGDFNPEKIYITIDGDIKLYDPFVDAYIANFIPKILQHLMEKLVMKTIPPYEDIKYDQCLSHLFKNDVFNFGSLILALNSDFQLLSIPSNIVKDQDLENEIREKQYSKIENFLNNISNNRSMVDLLWLCMSPEENKRPTFSILLIHVYINQCDQYLNENSKTIVNKVNTVLSDTDKKDDISTSRLKNEFKILECIGSGGFGFVFRASHKIDNMCYALKLVRLSGKREERVVKEVKLLSSLVHKNIVRYHSSWSEKLNKSFIENYSKNQSKYDGLEDPKYLLIQMEFCCNTLDNLLKSSNIVQNDQMLRWNIFKQICEGVEYIHRCSIIHRDLKQHNIFLDAKNNVKIGDFGLARYDYISFKSDRTKLPRYGKDSKFTRGVGTSFYIAPETRDGYPRENIEIDFKVDIFALGIIYCQLCCTFESRHVRFAELEQFQNKDPYISPHIKDEMSPKEFILMQRMTSYYPEQRPTSSEIIKTINEWIISNRNWPVLLNQLKSSDYRSLIAEVFSLDRPSFENINLISTNKWSKQSYHYKLMFTNYAQFIIQIHSHLFGAIQLSIPDLLPKHVLLDHSVPEHILIIDSNGTKMALPRDSRSSFGYFLALNQQINLLNRISVEKTFCKTPQSDYPYKHQFEITFNSVFPNNNKSKIDEWIFPYIEMIGFICQNLVNFLPINKNSLTLEPYYELMEEKKLARQIGNGIKLSIIATNIDLFHTIYKALNLPVNIYEQILSFFVQTKTESNLTKKDFLSRLTSFKMIDPKMAILLWDLHNISENTQTMFYRKISQVLLSYSNDDKSIQNLLEWTINLSIERMQTIKYVSEDYIDIKYRQYFQFKFTLTHLYDSTLYFKGVIFYFVMNNNNEELLIATGGNFDPMINNMRLRLRIRNQKSSHVFGSSIKLDNLVKMMETCVASKSNTPFNNDLLYRKMFENLMKNISKNTSDGSRYSSADIIVLPYFILDKSDGNTDRDDNNGNDDKDDDGGNKRKFFEKINSKYREILKFILQLRSKSYRTIVIPESFCDPFNSNQSLIKSEHFQHIHTEATNQSIKLIVVVLKQPKSIKYQLHIITNNCSYTDENFQFIFTQSTDALKKIDTILDFDN